MDWHHVLQALLSLVFVIGLLLLTLWLFKYCQLKGGNCRWARQLKAGARSKVRWLKAADLTTVTVSFCLSATTRNF